VIKKQGDRRSRPEREHRINREIRVPEVRVIDDEGQMLGVFSPQDAIKLAEEKGLDLIEIAPTASPPTCRIMDYGKWKYENKKKKQEAKKRQTIIVVKEIQMRPRTDDHDMDTKLKHARRFLLEGDKVKVNLRFMGREMAHQEIGKEVLDQVTLRLQDIAVLEVAPKMEGRQLFALYAPDPVKVKEYRAKMKSEAKYEAKMEAKALEAAGKAAE
jgi:translation initiation factor IF-3